MGFAVRTAQRAALVGRAPPEPAAPTPAVVLGAHTGALGVVRALGVMGVPVVVVPYDDRDHARHSRYVVKAVRAPGPTISEEGFVGVLERLASEYRGAVLFPVTDETLVAVARHRERLEGGYAVGCDAWDVARRCLEKRLTYELADAHGVPTPRTLTPESVEDVEREASSLSFPCLVKPSQSHLFSRRFGVKMLRVDDPQGLREAMRQAFEAGLEVMVQEYVPGGDALVVNYNAYAVEGEPLLEFTARHVRNAPPWLGSPRVAVSEAIPAVLEPGRAILRALGYTGFACVEFKWDQRAARFKLMDVNARHNLSTLLAVRAGVNFPWLHYRHLAYGELPRSPGWREGVYWIDVLRDVASSATFLGREGQGLRQLVRPYRGPRVFAIYDAADPRPFASRLAYLTRLVRRRALRRGGDGGREPAARPGAEGS